MENANLPKAFADGKTPEAWCQILNELHGIKLSARRVRSVARATGNFKCFGRGMLLLPFHVDEISAHLTRQDKKADSAFD